MAYPRREPPFPRDYTFSPEAGVYVRRHFGDGAVDLVPLTFGRGALQRGRAGADDYIDVWTFPSIVAAYCALTAWDGEGDPCDGWIRHQPSNRRRPDGSPASEYVEP